MGGAMSDSMTGFSDRFWWSRDGLRLHFRDYPAASDSRPPVVCLHGLTRNARDFEGLAPRLQAQGWRVLCPSMSGRGESAYAKDAMTYTPLNYLQDLDALFEAEAASRAVLIGTSLGGILTMLTAATRPGFVAGAIINDIGPVIDPEGIARIKTYVGRNPNWPSWLHAAREMMEAFGDVYPAWSVEDWLVYAKRVARVGEGGRIVYDYDPRIAEPFRLPGGEAPAGDMWPAFQTLEGAPVLVIRGGTSDILAPEVFEAMAERVPGVERLTIPDIGHAPTLDEPEAVSAILETLARV